MEECINELITVNLVCSEGLHVNGETGVHDGDVGNRILNAPVPGVPGLLQGQAKVKVRFTL